MNKIALLQDMVVVADWLDEVGLKKDAEVVDGMIEKVAQSGREDVALAQTIQTDAESAGVNKKMYDINKIAVGNRLATIMQYYNLAFQGHADVGGYLTAVNKHMVELNRLGWYTPEQIKVQQAKTTQLRTPTVPA